MSGVKSSSSSLLTQPVNLRGGGVCSSCGFRSIFITGVRLLWTLGFEIPIDKGGIPTLDPHAFSHGFSSHPLSFQSDLRARGPWVQKVVEQAVEIWGQSPVGV